MTPKTKDGSGCLTLFALPFAAVGAVTGFLCVRQLAEGSEDLQKTLLLGLFGIVFGGVGVGLIFVARWGKQRFQKEARLKQLHPDAPWMWNPEWATGRIKGSSHAAMWFTWAFALLWNLISAPLLFFLPGEIEKGNHAVLIGLLFPLVGVGLLYWAVRATIRYRKFGVSFVRLDTLPGVIGGRVRGTIQSGLRSRPPNEVKVTLHCLRRRKSRGKNSSTSESLLWEDSYLIGAHRLYPGAQGLDLPVEFDVPYECEETDESDPYNRIVWRLHAAAKVDGVDYATQFEIPVFRTQDSSTEAGQAASHRNRRASSQQFDSRDATTEIRRSALGGTEYYFAAARNRGAIAALTVFFLLLSGITAALFYFDVPLLFGIVSSFFVLLVTVFLVDMLLTSVRVVFEDGKVRIVRSTLGIRSSRQIPYSDVSDVKIKIGMQQQQTMTQDAKAYYDIQIHRRSGRRVTAGRSIPNKREAQWLVDQMLSHL